MQQLHIHIFLTCLARQVSVCTRFRATTVAVHTLEKQAGVMERGKRSTEKKWNPSALTRADQKDLTAETNKSAITDHVAKENYVIDWSGAMILDRESHRKTRQLKESICIRKEVNCMNRDRQPTTYQRPMTGLTIFWSLALRQHQ